MKLPHRRSARVAALTVLSLVAVGAGAVAQTSVPITLVSVNGTRTLQVTGVTGGAPVGSPTLALREDSLAAPFGLVVSDLAYDRVGYTVSATLSNLYKLGLDGLDCTTKVPATAFSVTYGAGVPATDLAAFTSGLTFVDDDLSTSLGLAPLVAALVGDVEVPVNEFLTSLTMMDVADGSTGAFPAVADHPTCEEGTGTTTKALQTGGPTAGADAAVLGAITTAAADGALSPQELVTAGLLPAGALEDGGVLYEATEAGVLAALSGLSDLVLAPLLADLDNIVTASIARQTADVTALVLDLLGQTGVYANLPSLAITEEAFAQATSGLYHGVLTVTLLDVG